MHNSLDLQFVTYIYIVIKKKAFRTEESMKKVLKRKLRQIKRIQEIFQTSVTLLNELIHSLLTFTVLENVFNNTKSDTIL